MDLRLIPAYLKAVSKHGWWLLFALVGGVGDVATVVGDFNISRWLWYSLIALGVLAAQFGAYCDVRAELATVRGRLHELDTVEAKRAYLDDCAQEGRELLEEVAALGADWYRDNVRMLEDMSHWEREIRAQIRKAWGPAEARRFDTNPDTGEPDRYGNRDPADMILGYIDRRLTQLTRLRDETH